jgi:hypothetical protein
MSQSGRGSFALRDVDENVDEDINHKDSHPLDGEGTEPLPVVADNQDDHVVHTSRTALVLAIASGARRTFHALLQNRRIRIMSILHNKIDHKEEKEEWLKQYQNWMDEQHPLVARCVIGAVTSILGAMLGFAASASANHKRRHGNNHHQTQQSSYDNYDYWMNVLSFGIHGGLVAGPLSYYM